jgi:16S rRNA processing protein RimM
MALVGRVARPHGIRGEVIVNLDTDFPVDRFQSGAELFTARGGDIERWVVRAVRFQQGRPVIALEGVDSISAAEQLAGLDLRIPAERLPALPAGVFYHHDLVGCVVEARGAERIGIVERIEGTMGTSRLIVATPQGEVQVPLAAEICTAIDIPGRRIVIEPPEGLIELNRTAR